MLFRSREDVIRFINTKAKGTLEIDEAVDGKPIDDPGKCSSDVKRCTDVALEKANIQFKHDSLRLEPRLNVTAWPRTIRYQDLQDTAFA